MAPENEGLPQDDAAANYDELAQEIVQLMARFHRAPHPSEGGPCAGMGPQTGGGDGGAARPPHGGFPFASPHAAGFEAAPPHAAGPGSAPPHPHGGGFPPMSPHGGGPARPPFPSDLRDASRGAPIVLASLSGEGGSATPSRLCELSGLSKGRVSNIVSSLESKGYVQKQPSPEDARSVTVTLTPKGRAFTDAHERAMRNHVAAILEKLGPQDAQDAVRILKHLAAIMAGNSHNADAAPAPVDSAMEGGAR